MSRFAYWCPNRCGKTVWNFDKSSTAVDRYKCNRCDKRFKSKNEVLNSIMMPDKMLEVS